MSEYRCPKHGPLTDAAVFWYDGPLCGIVDDGSPYICGEGLEPLPRIAHERVRVQGHTHTVDHRLRPIPPEEGVEV